MHNPGDCKR